MPNPIKILTTQHLQVSAKVHLQKGGTFGKQIANKLQEAFSQSLIQRLNPETDRLMIETIRSLPSLDIGKFGEESLKTYLEEQLSAKHKGEDAYKQSYQKLVQNLGTDKKISEFLHLDKSLEQNPFFEEETLNRKWTDFAKIAGLEDDQTLFVLNQKELLRLPQAEMWAQLKKNIAPEKVDRLHFTHQLSKFTNNNLKLTNVLLSKEFTHLPKKKVTHPVDLARLNQTDWETLLSKNKIEPPANTTIKDYAKNLVNLVEKTFPSEVFIDRMIRYDASAIRKAIGDNKKKDLDKLSNKYKALGIREILNTENLKADQKEKSIQKRLAYLDKFRENNPGFDIFKANFFKEYAINPNGPSNDNDPWKGFPASEKEQVRKQMMNTQRVSRLAGTAEQAELLQEFGYDSAISITNESVGIFKEKVISDPRITDADALKVYEKAQATIIGGAHTLINAALLGGIDDFNATTVGNISPDLVNELRKIDGYEELFGSLNDNKCPEYRSVLGPCAYFVDLMRFIEEHITFTPKVTGINNTIHLENRRLDLWKMELTEDNTFKMVPYIDVVLDILERYVAKLLEVDQSEVYEAMSSLAGSSLLPFNLPAIQLEKYLSHFNTNLADLYESLEVNEEFIAAAILGLSPAEFAIIANPHPEIGKSYFGFAKEQNVISSMRVEDFLRHSGLSREELEKFKTLDYPRGGGILIIDRKEEKDSAGNTSIFEEISGLSVDVLDRSQRFLRLRKKLSCNLETLDWILRRLIEQNNERKLDDFLLKELSRMLKIKKVLGLSIEEMCSLCLGILDVPQEVGKYSYLQRVFWSNPSLTGATFLLSGLSISESDLKLLLENLKITIHDDKQADIGTLSILYRYAKLANSLKIGVGDLLKIVELCFPNTKQIKNVADIVTLIDFIKWVQASPLKLEDLWFAFRGEQSPKLVYQVNTEKITNVLTQIRDKKSLHFHKSNLSNTVRASVVDIDKTVNFLKDKKLVLEGKQPSSFLLATSRISLDDLKDLEVKDDLKKETWGFLNKYEVKEVIKGHLTEHLNLSAPLCDNLLNWVNFEEKAPDILHSLTRDDNIVDILPLTNLFREMEQMKRLVKQLEISDSAFHFMTTHKECFNIKSFAPVSAPALRSMIAYSDLLSRATISEERLNQLIADYDNKPVFVDKLKTLSLLLGQKTEVLQSVVEGNFSFHHEPIEDILRLEQLAAICVQLGISGTSLKILCPTSQGPSKAEYARLQKASGIVYSAFRSKYADEKAWEKLMQPFEDDLRRQKRDALVNCILSTPDLKFFKINDLYNYFLIDTEIEPCAMVSRVLAGISSLQLYVHRCRLNLEQTDKIVAQIDDPDLFNAEWEWRKNYRLWEANRKVFLFPENWIEPDLRDDKSPFFKELEEELLQQKVTFETARDAYKVYMAKFLKVANLKIVGSYCDNQSKTLYFFGKTSGDGSEYFYRTCSYRQAEATGKLIWSPWEKVDLAINAEKVSPIVYQNKLYVFWVEIRTRSKTEVKGGSSEFLGYMHKVILKYSHLNTNGKWLTPNSIVLKEKVEDRLSKGSYWEDAAAASMGIIPSVIVSSKNSVLHDKRNDVSSCEPLVLHFEPLDDYTLRGFEWDKIYLNIIQDRLVFYYCSGDTDFLNFYFKERDYFDNPVYKRQNIDFYHSIDFFNNIFHKISEITLNLSILEPLWAYEKANLFHIVKSKILTKSVINVDHFYAALINGENENLVRNYDDKLILGTSHYQLDDNPILIGTTPNKPNIQYINKSSDRYIIEVNGDSIAFIPDPNPPKGIIKQGYGCFIRLGTTIGEKLNNLLYYNNGLSNLLSIKTQIDAQFIEAPLPFTKNSSFDRTFYHQSNKIDFNIGRPCGLYYTELYFHIPFLIANHLNANQQYEEAQKWYHFLFNPTSTEAPDVNRPADRNWQWIEFRGQTFEKLVDLAQNKAAIDVYESNPFNPHAIARERFSAYPKAIVMKYIDNLLDWADQLFTRDTYESINEATLLYILATEILGERPKELPEIKTVPDEYLTYQNICDHAKETEGKSNDFIINLENFFQQSNNGAGTTQGSNGKPTPLSISNQALTGNTGQDILPDYHGSVNTVNVSNSTVSGTVTGGTVTVAGGTVTGGTVIGGTAEAVNATDTTVAQQNIQQGASSLSFAKSLYNDVPIFGLPFNEKFRAYWDRTADRLYKIRHCMNIEGIVRQLPLFQPPIDPGLLVKAKAAGLNLTDIASFNAKLPPYRFSFLVEKAKSYAATVQGFGSALLSALEKKDAEELNLLRQIHEQNILKLTKQVKKDNIKKAEADLEGAQKMLEQATQRRDYYNNLVINDLNIWEIFEFSSSKRSADYKLLERDVRRIAFATYLVPQLGSLFALKYGGKELGDSLKEWAEWFSSMASISSTMSSLSGLRASFQRRREGWGFNLNQSEIEIEKVTKQVVATEISLVLADRDFEIYEQSMEQSREIHDFYKHKFTNLGLYNWLAVTLNRLYQEAYNMAFQLAQQAELAFHFECDNDPATYIQLDNWNYERAGLLAGERLMLQLQQMEKSYLENNDRRYEVSQHFSLMMLAPESLIDLRESGICSFGIPEAVFDLSYPGQYKRLIKSVQLTIPCVAGPYTNISCKLELQESFVRDTIDDVEVPPQKMPELRYKSIATSHAQNDSGLFELNFRDERYLPFEGAGAISSWQLELPTMFRQFDYGTISDVIIHLNYTARDGGDDFKDKVNKQIREDVNACLADIVNSKQPLTLMLSMKHHFPVEWEQLKSGKVPDLTIQERYFPFMVRDKNPTFNPTDVMLYAKGSTKPLVQGNNGEYFTVTLRSEKINFLKPGEWPDDLYLIVPYTITI